MKKIVVLMLGLSLVFGSVDAFAQGTATKTTQKTKKTKKQKTTDSTNKQK